jgi:hypothetical protein
MNCTARHGYRQHRLLLQRQLGQWAAGLELGLTPVHQRIVHTLDLINMEALLGYSAKTAGAPEHNRVALAQAFVAKAVLGFEQTTQLRSRLAVDTVLRRLLGFESNRRLPSEATFSRAFAEFARTGLPAKAHEALIRQHLGQVVIGHIARDSTAIHARARTQYSPAETAALNEAKAAKRHKRKRAANTH